jgi:hypothetical protein
MLINGWGKRLKCGGLAAWRLHCDNGTPDLDCNRLGSQTECPCTTSSKNMSVKFKCVVSRRSMI